MNKYLCEPEKSVSVRLSSRKMASQVARAVLAEINDCACSPASSAEKPADKLALEFANRKEELKWLLDTDGLPNKVIDAPVGYGKTTLLHKAADEYAEDWARVVIELTIGQDRFDILDEIASHITGKSITIRHEPEAQKELQTLLAGMRVIIFFDNAEIDKSNTIWLREHIIPELQKSNAQVRVVFAGRGLSRDEWGAHSYIYKSLSGFSYQTVQEILDRKKKGDSNALQFEPVHDMELALSIAKLSGGHPGIIAELVQGLVEDGWTADPKEAQFRELMFDRTHIGVTLQQMIKDYGFTPLQQKNLEPLSVFRIVHPIITIKPLIDRQDITGREKDPYAVLAIYTKPGIFFANGDDIFYRDSLVRGLMLSWMETKEPKRYHDLNYTAREIYHEWIEKIPGDSPAAPLIEVYAKESFFHTLQLGGERNAFDELRYLSRFSSEEHIQDWLEKNEDIRLRVRFLFGKTIPELCECLFLPEATKGKAYTLGDTEARYSQGIVAILDKTGKHTIGTGSLATFGSTLVVVTCAHLFDDLNEPEGQKVTVRHFDPELDQQEATIAWLKTRRDIVPEDWSAVEDIAILELKSPWKPKTKLLSFEESLTIQQDFQIKESCWCFEFSTATRGRGTWVEGVTCGKRIAQGFVELSLLKANKKIVTGASGAPLCHKDTILGMIQGYIGDVGHLIPSGAILDVLKRYSQEKGKQQ